MIKKVEEVKIVTFFFGEICWYWLILFFFFFCQYWGLNSGPLPFESLCQSFFVSGIFEIESCELFAQADLKL
jgi:hypothetical protein